MPADPTKLAEARAALAVHDHHPREVCPECCEDVCDPCVDALRWALGEIDCLTAEAADYVAVCPYCMARVSACDEERCCATCGTDLVVCTDDHGAEMLLLALNEAAAGDVTKWMVGCENKRVERIRLDDEITAARLIATGKVSAEHAQDDAGLVGEVATLRAERNRLTAKLAEARAMGRREGLEEAAGVCRQKADDLPRSGNPVALMVAQSCYDGATATILALAAKVTP